MQLSILLNGPGGNIKLKAGKLFNGEVISIKDLERRTKVRNWLLSISVFLGIGILALLSRSFPLSLSSNELITWLLIIVVVWMILVAFAPFRCAHRYCGYRTWNPKYMPKHIEGKHSFA